MTDDRPFDDLERRSPDAREAALMAALPSLIRHAKASAPGLARHLAGIEPDEIDGRQALETLPVLRKGELADLQAGEPPFGGLAATPVDRLAKVYMSPGPIFECEGRGADYWRIARAMHAAGFRPGDLIHNTFAYHLTPAGSMIESGARALGCPVIPAGTGQSERQVEAIRRLRPRAYAGTPSFLRILLERADTESIRLDSLERALVSGEAFPKSAAEQLSGHYGIDAFQCYATADLGLIAYETAARDGMVLDEGVLVELVSPGTGDPVPEGNVGEVVVTTFNHDYPLIRFATGDLSAFLAGPSPCGRTNRRLAGWLGRADQITKVRGMFVHPRQLGAVAARHPELGRLRLVVEHQAHRDVMTLHCEADGPVDGLAKAVADTLQAVTGLRGEALIVDPGSLPDDGKMIDDRRDHG